MIGVQLGWLADALNWLFKKVLQPVFDWLSNLLSTVLSWVFNTILQPILEFVFETVLADLFHEILRIICLFFLSIFQLLLMIVDAITKLFEIFAGLSPVTMRYFDNDNKLQEVNGSLLYCIYKTPFVTRALVVLFILGVGLCFLFAVVAVIRSIGEFDGREGRPVAHVLRMTAKAMLRLIMVPLFGMFMIVLSSTILNSISKAFSGSDNNFSITRTIFVITTFDAVDVKKNYAKKNGKMVTGLNPRQYNSSTGSNAAFDDPYRSRFYDPGGTSKGDDLMYDVVEIEKTFDVVKINYLQGYLLCLAFIIMLIASVLIFICRIFDVILLLIVSPLFVAPMPFDDGEHYEKWQELFIGKLFGGYGMIIAMNTYLIVAAALFNGSFRLVADGQFAVIEDALIKLIFMIGGVYAVLNVGPLVTSILSQTAANAEMTQGAVMSGAMWDAAFNPGKLQTAVTGFAKSKIKGAISGKGTQGKVISGGGHGFSPDKAPRQGAGSVPGLSGRGGMSAAGRAYAMSTMMATPERTMRKQKFSDGSSMDDVLGISGLEIDQRTVDELKQNFTTAKPGEKPGQKPGEKPGDKTQSTAGGPSDAQIDKSLEGTIGPQGAGAADKGGAFSGQSSSQAARSSDLGVPPAPTTHAATITYKPDGTVSKTTTGATSSQQSTQQPSQQSSSQPTLSQDLGISSDDPFASDTPFAGFDDALFSPSKEKGGDMLDAFDPSLFDEPTIDGGKNDPDGGKF